MNHPDLYQLRDTYNRYRILLCFNGPFSQGLIVELGNALKKHLQSEQTVASSAMDVFAAYVEIAQNIQQYASARGYSEAEASATVVIVRDSDGHYAITAGNIVEKEDGDALVERVNALAAMDKAQLKAAYKTQLRQPRPEGAATGAGLGLIDIARKSTAPFSCSLLPVDAPHRRFFSLHVVI